MSHAANLRNAQRSPHPSATSPSKRRRVNSASTRPQPNGKINGLLNGDVSQKLSAVPVKDAKAPAKQKESASNAVIGYADENEDTSMDEASEGAKCGSSVGSEDSDKGQDDNGPSESESSEGAEDKDEQTPDQKLSQRAQKEKVQSSRNEPGEDTKMVQQGQAEPSFGDLLRTRGEEPLTVAANIPADSGAPESHEPKARLSTQQASLPVPSTNSLGSVLTQALRTNDAPLLESCLQVSSLPSIRATIERLPSAHASNLLQKLAERMHKRPGRAGSLMVWIQWTIVAHGGYLAGQPAAMRSLQALYRVVKQRASGLQPLLALKGKLDMLEAQLQIRRNRMTAGRHGGREGGSGPGVVYVEGEESSSSEDEEHEDDRVVDESGNGLTNDISGEHGNMASLLNGIDTSEDQDEDENVDEGQDDSSEGEEGLIDDEAESTDEDSEDDMLEDDVDYDDVDEDDLEEALGVPDSDNDDPAGEAPLPKRRKNTSQ